MKKFYEKSELWFTMLLIAVYCVGQSLAAWLSGLIGVEYSANAIMNAVFAVFLLVFPLKNGLGKKYGLCASGVPAQRFLWYIPLVLLCTGNFWNGFAVNLEPAAMTCYILSMASVGVIEEVLFRGLLFRLLEKDGVKSAIAVSSVTFGLGHILNLLNGFSQDVLSTLCQVVGAIAIGFLFVVIVYRGGSLIPCILTHSGIDVTSAFANEAGLTPEKHIAFTVVRLLFTVAYALILLKTLPKKEQ